MDKPQIQATIQQLQQDADASNHAVPLWIAQQLITILPSYWTEEQRQRHYTTGWCGDFEWYEPASVPRKTLAMIDRLAAAGDRRNVNERVYRHKGEWW